MPTDRLSHAELPAIEMTERPSVDEIVGRLDGLWREDRVRTASPLPAHAPQRVGRYRIERVLGRGSFGIVYLARDEQLGRDVALKIPRPEVLVDKERLGRFEAEARAAAALDHPGIVPLYEAELDGSAPYIASALCVGPDLATWLEGRVAPTPWQDAARLVAHLAGAIHFAHEKGVLHRDLKPSNVMLAPDEQADSNADDLARYQPRLTDFGLAKLVESGMTDTRSSILIGTPLYMAPELFSGLNGAEASPAADIYSLGCILYELLAGRPPIEGDSYIQIIDRLRESPPKKLRTLRRDIPRALEAICAKCLEKDPRARYESAAELARDLNACLHSEPMEVERAGLLTRFRYWQCQPKRVRDAGLFAVGFHLVSALWLLSCEFLILRLGIMSRAQFFHNMGEHLLMLGTFDIPFIIIGWQTLLGRPWAIWAGMAMSVLQVLMLALAITGVVTPFELIYRNAEYHREANFALVFLCCIAQFLLYFFALQARKRAPL